MVGCCEGAFSHTLDCSRPLPEEVCPFPYDDDDDDDDDDEDGCGVMMRWGKQDLLPLSWSARPQVHTDYFVQAVMAGISSLGMLSLVFYWQVSRHLRPCHCRLESHITPESKTPSP